MSESGEGRDEKGRFLPGSPACNRAGRGPLSPDAMRLRDLARQHAPDAISEIARIMTTSRSPRTRLAAAQMLLDRGFGRPIAPHIVAGELGSAYFTSEKYQTPYERARRVAAVLREVTPRARSQDRTVESVTTLEHTDGRNS